MEFVLASNNKKKLAEMEQILSELGHSVVAMGQLGVTAAPEETGGTFEENARIKARAAVAATGKPCIADDSGLEVDALGGAPGVLSARYGPGSDQDRVDKLLRALEGVPQAKRGGRFVSAVACVFPDGREIVARGECHGRILTECRGHGGFGYDPVFYVDREHATFSEMPQEIKNGISHRAKAMEAFACELKKIEE